MPMMCRHRVYAGLFGSRLPLVVSPNVEPRACCDLQCAWLQPSRLLLYNARKRPLGRRAAAANMADREKRATAGRRMANIVGEELEKDETFWGDKVWDEHGDESEYSDTSDSEDVVDTDFDESEEEDEDEDEEENERALAKADRKKAKQKYRDPSHRVVRKPAPILSAEEAEALRQQKREAARLRREAELALPVSRAKRKSTQQKTEAVQQALAKDAERSRPRYAAPKKRTTKFMFTQEQMLMEACRTEHDSAKWLLMRKRMQTESDSTGAQAPKRQVKYAARFVSRRGSNHIVNFPEVDLMPEILRNQERPESPPDGHRRGAAICAVTGLPARYKDPLTGQPFANAEAFRMLRKKKQKLVHKPVEVAV